jgi:hypothetical protein
VPVRKWSAETVGDTITFRLNPTDPAFAKEPGWQDAFDDLRERQRKRGERIGEWRKRVPVRAIAFEPPRLPDGRDTPEIVQVHLEHRLVRRLLSRFLSQGFQAGLSRISVIEGPGAQPAGSADGAAFGRSRSMVAEMPPRWFDSTFGAYGR